LDAKKKAEETARQSLDDYKIKLIRSIPFYDRLDRLAFDGPKEKVWQLSAFETVREIQTLLTDEEKGKFRSETDFELGLRGPLRTLRFSTDREKLQEAANDLKKLSDRLYGDEL
jgi:hypothetical protein